MSNSSYIRTLLARGGGLITCGERLGVMIGTDHRACPRGWVFIPADIATVELVRQAIQQASQGRAEWPKNQRRTPRNQDEMLEQVFDSQDYIE